MRWSWATRAMRPAGAVDRSDRHGPTDSGLRCGIGAPRVNRPRTVPDQPGWPRPPRGLLDGETIAVLGDGDVFGEWRSSIGQSGWPRPPRHRRREVVSIGRRRFLFLVHEAPSLAWAGVSATADRLRPNTYACHSEFTQAPPQGVRVLTDSRHDDVVRTQHRLPEHPSPEGSAIGSPWMPGHAGLGVAVFDLDRTLLRGSSLSLYGRVARAPGTSHRDQRLPGTRSSSSGSRTEVYEGHASTASSGPPRGGSRRAGGTVGGDARTMGPTLLSNVRHGARFLLDLHRAAGDFCVVVSASPQDSSML